MPPQLLALTDGPNIPLDKPIVLLGRHQECDIQLASRKVSRKHCCIAQVHDYLVVRDLGSTNGIRINGVRVSEGTLKAGDELTVGNHQYRVEWDGAGPSAKPYTPSQAYRVSEAEALESYDEPIPIAEPVKSPPGMPLPPALTPTERASTPGSSGPPILPDQIELAPS